jgi:hypothetical protein
VCYPKAIKKTQKKTARSQEMGGEKAGKNYTILLTNCKI